MAQSSRYQVILETCAKGERSQYIVAESAERIQSNFATIHGQPNYEADEDAVMAISHALQDDAEQPFEYWTTI